MNARIEQVLLHPLLTGEEIRAACEDARHEGYHGICVPSGRVEEAYEFIEDSSVKVSCLVGYPFGTIDADVKRFEAEAAADYGAHEIDVMANLGWIKEGNYKRVLRELRDVVHAADERPVKVLVEFRHLSSREIEEAVAVVLESGAQYLCPGRGFLEAGNASGIIAQARRLAGDRFGIKGLVLDDLASVQELVEAGADRVGILRTRGGSKAQAVGI